MRSIERAEARNAQACATARASLFGFTAESRWLAGGNAIYAGHWTHLTQAVAVGVSGPVEVRAVSQLRRFFEDRLTVPTACVSEMLPEATRALLNGGFREIGQVHAVARSTRGRWISDPRVRVAAAAETLAWERASSEGFLGREPSCTDDLEIGAIVTRFPAAVRFVAAGPEIEATAALAIWSGTALLFADSTVPRFRGRGTQQALIRARLKYAAEHRCRLAAAFVTPGSASERNYLRCGFRVGYRRLVLQAPA